MTTLLRDIFNQESLTLWIEALRSDNYQPGRFRLKDYNRYCPLGVACNVSNKIVWEAIAENYRDSLFANLKFKPCPKNHLLYTEQLYYEASYYALSDYVLDWLFVDFRKNFSLENREVRQEYLEFVSTITQFNDIDRLSFLEIANYLEVNYVVKE